MLCGGIIVFVSWYHMSTFMAHRRKFLNFRLLEDGNPFNITTQKKILKSNGPLFFSKQKQVLIAFSFLFSYKSLKINYLQPNSYSIRRSSRLNRFHINHLNIATVAFLSKIHWIYWSKEKSNQQGKKFNFVNVWGFCFKLYDKRTN